MKDDRLAALCQPCHLKYDHTFSDFTKRVDKHERALFILIDEQYTCLMHSKDFREELKSALNAKVARCIVSKMDGELEKRVNELKANP